MQLRNAGFPFCFIKSVICSIQKQIEFRSDDLMIADFLPSEPKKFILLKFLFVKLTQRLFRSFFINSGLSQKRQIDFVIK